MLMKKSFRLREVFLILSIFTLTSNLSVASNLPNFTSIVDDNIDAVVIVNIVLNNEYVLSADMNSDNTIDVLDVVLLVNIIL